MKVRLNKKQLDSTLEGFFYLNQEPKSYAQAIDDGTIEHIFVYEDDKLPTAKTEPELFNISHNIGEETNNNQTWLKYELATVILITQEEDNEFREQEANLVHKVEVLYIE